MLGLSKYALNDLTVEELKISIGSCPNGWADHFSPTVQVYTCRIFPRWSPTSLIFQHKDTGQTTKVIVGAESENVTSRPT